MRAWNQVRKLAMLEEYFEEEEEEEQQQQPASAEVAVTNSGQQNHPNCFAICSSRSQRKGTVRQMWRGPVRGALFRGISHKSQFVIQWYLG